MTTAQSLRELNQAITRPDWYGVNIALPERVQLGPIVTRTSGQAALAAMFFVGIAHSSIEIQQRRARLITAWDAQRPRVKRGCKKREMVKPIASITQITDRKRAS